MSDCMVEGITSPATQYDVIYYTPDQKSYALERVRRVALEERKERFGGQHPLGLRIKQGIKMPGNPGNDKTPILCNCVWIAKYGTLAFDPEKPVDLDIKIQANGIVCGDIKPETFESPAYAAAARDEKTAEADAKKHREASQKEDNAAAAVEALMVQAYEILALAGVPQEKITQERLTRCIERVSHSVQSNSVARAVAFACDEVGKNGRQPEPMPPEIANDPEARAAILMAGLCKRHETTRRI